MRSRSALLLATLVFSGCFATPYVVRKPWIPPTGTTATHAATGPVFEKVGVLDFRRDTIEDYQRMVRPGDLIVDYMRLGRAVKKREWLFAILPHGHAIIVLDPHDPQGLFECRFHGARRVGVEELALYSYNTVYRLREPHRLHLGRLNEFAAYACEGTTKYSFSSWMGRNDNLRPARPQDISPKYTCSTMVTAAYHYAGLTLDLVEDPHRVIFPRSIANGTGHWNLFALPSSSTADTRATTAVVPKGEWRPAAPTTLERLPIQHN